MKQCFVVALKECFSRFGGSAFSVNFVPTRRKVLTVSLLEINIRLNILKGIFSLQSSVLCWRRFYAYTPGRHSRLPQEK